MVAGGPYSRIVPRSTSRRTSRGLLGSGGWRLFVSAQVLGYARLGQCRCGIGPGWLPIIRNIAAQKPASLAGVIRWFGDYQPSGLVSECPTIQERSEEH